MAQYQSFPDAAGDSRTLDKLRALRLPGLEGKTFLDVGCNEGFFCGYAQFAGAHRVVGLDKSRLFLDRARRRFPSCEFVLGDWTNLPDGPFDVVLLASALHYADDQEALVRQLVGLLSRDGVLVLEMGLVNSARSEWRKVKRGDDQRLFPSMKKLEEILEPYAWKWLGPSVDQAGDPVKRHVVHVSRRRPRAYLLMQPPGFGKSTLARDLFKRAGVQTVSGDELILQVARGQRPAPEALRRLLSEQFSPFRIDELIRDVFASGLGEALVNVFVDAVQSGDFALDVYVPDASHSAVEAAMHKLGYLPVRLSWDRAGPAPQGSDQQAQVAAAWMEELSARPLRKRPTAPPALARGYVDHATVEDGQLVLTGWATDAGREHAPERIEVEFDGVVHACRTTVQPRRDVQRRLRLSHERFGFRVAFALPGDLSLQEALRRGRVTARWAGSESAPLRYSMALEEIRAGHRA